MEAYFDINAKVRERILTSMLKYGSVCYSDDYSLDEPTIAINNCDFFHTRLFKILFLEIWNKEILHYYFL